MQENWIGKSRACNSAFSCRAARRWRSIPPAPTRSFGASFVAIAAEHPVAQAGGGQCAGAAFIDLCKAGGTTAAELETAEKLGFDTGLTAPIPSTGEWQLPVYIANFVLMDYGTGAVMGVPGA
jgi:leucyl-tRNA synthetase